MPKKFYERNPMTDTLVYVGCLSVTKKKSFITLTPRRSTWWSTWGTTPVGRPTLRPSSPRSSWKTFTLVPDMKLRSEIFFWPLCPFVHLSMCLSVSLFVCLSVYQSIHLFFCLFDCSSVWQSVIQINISKLICWSVFVSINSSSCPSVCTFVWLFI